MVFHRLAADSSARTAAGGLEQEFKTELNADATTVLVVRTQPQKAML
jgi:hypothetical protein